MERSGRGHGSVFVDHQRPRFGPEFLVGGAHGVGNVRVLFDDVGGLLRVALHVVERGDGRLFLALPAFPGAALADVAETLVAHREVSPFALVRVLAGLPAAFVGEEVAVGPANRVRALYQRQQIAPLHPGFRDLRPRQRGQRRQNVDVRGDRADVVVGRDFAVPTHEKRHADAAFIRGTLQPLHVRVVEREPFGHRLARPAGTAAGHAVVAHENHHGVLHQLPFVQFFQQAAHVFVDVLDHPVKPGGFALKPAFCELFRVRGRGDERPVRRIGGDVGEERRIAVLDALNPAHPSGVEQVRAIALGFHEAAVVANHGVEIFVARRISAGAIVGLADPARAMDECFVETALMRLVRLLIAQMPFAENPGGVAGGLEHLRQRRRIQRHPLALQNGVGHAVFHRVTPGHDRRARGRTGRANQEPGKSGGCLVQLVQIRRFDPRMPVRADGSVALVVGNEQDDVRFGASQLGRGQARKQCENGKRGDEGFHAATASIAEAGHQVPFRPRFDRERILASEWGQTNWKYFAETLIRLLPPRQDDSPGG